jgi:hypothetical protein
MVQKSKAIDTLGEGELSLQELGFDSDSANIQNNSEEAYGTPSGENHERSDIVKTSTADLVVPIEHQRGDSTSRARRSLTVPVQIQTPQEVDVPTTVSEAGKPRRLSSLSSRSDSRRNESVASRASSDAPVGDENVRRSRKRSSLGTADGLLDSPKTRPLGTPDAAEEQENEDGLYIHGKDGKKHKVPITGFAVQSGKRNRDFHALFKSVEESDYLIEGLFPGRTVKFRLLLRIVERNPCARANVCFGALYLLQ